MISNSSPIPVKKNAIFFIFLTILIDCIGLGIIIPVLPTLLKDITGGNISQTAAYGGWLSFAYAIMSFLFSPVLGGLSDKFGRRPIILISLLGLGIEYIFCAAAPTLAWLFVGRILAGICGASFTTASAFIADVSDDSNRAKNFGMIGAAFGIGFIIGPLLGSLFGSMGSRVPFYVAAGFSLLNFIYGYFVLPESLPEKNRRAFDWKRANPLGSLKQLSKHKIVINLMLIMFVLELAGQAMPSVWTFFCIERFNWSEATIGLSLATVGVAIAIVQGGLIGLAQKKLGEKKSLFLGLIFSALGYFLFSFANKPWMIFAFLMPFALGGFAIPNLQSIITKNVPNNEQGELQGGLTSLISLTAVIGPIVMSNSFSYFTKTPSQHYFPGVSFFIGGILSLFCIFFSYSALKKMR